MKAIVLFFFILNVVFPQQEKGNAEMESIDFPIPANSKISKVVFDTSKCFIALDSSGCRLFEIFPYDNGPDYPSEGCFRIVEENKIGFADLNGKVIINPNYDAALPFNEGLAAVCIGCEEKSEGEHKTWMGGKWGFVDSKGNVAVPIVYEKIISDFTNGYAQVMLKGEILMIDKKGEKAVVEAKKYEEWTRLLCDALKNYVKLNNAGNYALSVTPYLEGRDTPPVNYKFHNFRLTLSSGQSNKKIAEIILIPWQTFSLNGNQQIVNDPLALMQLVGVNDYCLVYALFPGEKTGGDEADFVEDLKQLLNKYAELNMDEDNYPTLVPDGIQIIASREFDHFIEWEIAEPGSKIPPVNELAKISDKKMLHVTVVPDFGPVKEYWIKPANLYIDTYYTSIEDELLNIFSECIAKCGTNPENRNEIFASAEEQFKNLFTAANSWVNYLSDKYKARLSNWLMIEEPAAEYPGDENIFPDYQPKLTPDTAIDYMPQLAEEFKLIPEAKLEDLANLLQLFHQTKEKVLLNPGQWEDGNIILGAKEKEYKPTKDELLLAEIGSRIELIINSSDRDKITDGVQSQNINEKQIEFDRFTFVHADVMGSGRFFYVDQIENVAVLLQP